MAGVATQVMAICGEISVWAEQKTFDRLKPLGPTTINYPRPFCRRVLFTWLICEYGVFFSVDGD